MVTRFYFYFCLFALILAPVGGYLSVTLFQLSQSQETTFFAVGAFIFSLLPLLFWQARERLSGFLHFLSYLSLLVWLGITTWLIMRAPDGKTASPASARIQNRYIEDEWRYPRASLGNLFPESDQLRLGLHLTPTFFSSGLDRPTSKLLDPIIMDLYQQMNKDPDFSKLGTVMPHAYDDIFTGRSDHGHYFLYIPKNLDRSKPAPALVFLHGFGGNFKVFSWLLSKVADDLQAVLIAPTLGNGTWHEPATSKLIYTVLADAQNLVSLDPDKKHLIGFSRGGLGVCQAGAEIARNFQSLTFISPLFDERAMDSVKFMDHWKERRALILTGTQDKTAPFDTVVNTARKLRKRGTDTTLETFPEAGHFLIFTHKDQVIAKLTSWLKSEPQAPAPESPDQQPPPSQRPKPASPIVVPPTPPDLQK